MKEDLVSVCIPAYNAGRYIGKTLSSLLEQTYGNIEIIISDNDSTDGTAGIISEFERKDKRIRYFKNTDNIGYVRNISEAVRHAGSGFIAVYHADDIYEPGIVEREKFILDRIPDSGGVFTRFREFYGEYPASFRCPSIYRGLERSGLLNRELGCFQGYLNDYLPFLIKTGNFFACPSFMTRKNIFEQSGGFTNNYPSNEDLELWLKIMNKGYSMAIIDEPLLNYRRTAGQGSSYWERSEDLPAFFKVMDDFLKSSPGLSGYIDNTDYRKNKADGYLTAAYNSFIKNNRPVFLKNKKASLKEYRFFPFTKRGLYQNLSFLAFSVKKIIRNKRMKARL